MKRTFSISISMAAIVCAMTATAMFSSCSSNDEEQVVENQQKQVELKITAGISTRAVNASWTSGDKIGVFSMDGTTPSYSNMSYTTVNGDGNFTPSQEDQTIMLPYDSESRTIAAYYPFTAAAASGTYTIDVSNQSNQEAIDLLVANPVSNVSKTSPVAALEFHHKLVKIDLTISPGEGITQEQLASMTVTISNQPTTGTCDVINNGNVVVTSTNTSTITLLTTNNGATSEAILLPVSSTENMILTFDIPNAGVYKWAVNSAAKSQSFDAGNKYKYDISINKTSLIVNSSIEDWTQGNGEGENGNAI
ncbi:MAG: fimbrillin family protein [Prevotella sp.]|nr:fimbrillin family protein [Prevotella sp.]